MCRSASSGVASVVAECHWARGAMGVATTYLLIVSQLVLGLSSTDADRPCAPRLFAGSASVVCVCNATYCDDVTRDQPACGTFRAYTTAQDGLRFSKSCGQLQSCDSIQMSALDIFHINLDKKYQKIQGFGGAATDATGIHWVSLPDAQKKFFIDSYCSSSGLEYNMFRVPIGGCDFSTHAYTYNETPEDDKDLTNYTLSKEDYLYKLPLIKACMSVSTSAVQPVATTWSAPVWMKTNDNITGVSLLRRGYYDSYALYHTKFIEKYEKEGVPIWAITTTNEPSNGETSTFRINDLGFTPNTMANWIADHLGPAMRKRCPHVKVLAVDDQRSTIPTWFEEVVKLRPDSLKFIDGIAVHWYEDKKVSPEVLSDVASKYPDKFILGTEACSGFLPTDVKVDLGSWSRAKDYVTDIIEDLNHYVVGWIDWNMALDLKGGPNWVDNFVDSPVIVVSEAGEFYKQPMFYAMGHFSKFLPRGSVRVDMSAHPLQRAVKHVAFVTPRNTVVAVLYNDAECPFPVSLQVSGQGAVLELPATSVTTVEIALQQCTEQHKRESLKAVFLQYLKKYSV